MDTNLYLKNVLKTLSGRPAQLGLRRVAGNKIRTHLMHAGLGIANEMAEFMEVIEPWLSGASQWHEDLVIPAKDELGDVGYFMMVLAKYLKVKTFNSHRKLKLHGLSPTAAIFRMNSLASQIAGIQKKNFYGPQLMSQGGVLVPDLEATKLMEAKRNEKMRALLTDFIPLYWGLTHDLFSTVPEELFEMNIAKLSARYADGFFSTSAEVNKDPEAEAAAQAA